MKILISNDDGYFASGISHLASAVRVMGEVRVVAPEQDRSGASNSLTLDRPLMLKKASNGFEYVNGTPTDCVHLAVTGFPELTPDIVLSGINHGANMGDDTLYSGTVAAATEGFLLGIPAMAFSLVGKHATHFDTAARVAAILVEKWMDNPFPEMRLLNINIPDVPFDELTGFEVTRLGKRHKAEGVIRAKNPRGEDIYWVGPAGKEQDNGPGTDFHAISQLKVSITPLQMDLSAKQQLAEMNEWLSNGQ
ncbi:5'/3'-nucleotidase SurE [Leeia sp. TBRC 13508]|uniref:5'-nucleotidase SurE n=1 Tax=Leeia speluncae TaxID=2884804 RepID=A0ABS8D7Y2_9NEIS|nr:5'/3'-nucleotidase SurE [Leeia speluncae]MCB6184319.1 5'/3'-nucleotidase SurE [Leeia speluncae]